MSAANPFAINWAALSVFPKEQVVCAACGHNYVSRAKKTASQLLIAETACPLCGGWELNDKEQQVIESSDVGEIDAEFFK